MLRPENEKDKNSQLQTQCFSLQVSLCVVIPASRHNLSRVVMIFTICLSHLVSPFCLPLSPSLSPSLVLSSSTCMPVPVGEHHQHEFPEAFPGCQVDQAAETGLHHTYSAMDFCTIFQGLLSRHFDCTHKDVTKFFFHFFLLAWQVCNNCLYFLFSNRLYLTSASSLPCFSSYMQLLGCRYHFW